MTARALTIAGSDPGGGAGIQADLKTFSAFRVFGMSAITAITVQNTLGVRGAAGLPPQLVAGQIDAVLEDIGADAVKLGMLFSAPVIKAVAGRLKAHKVGNLVLDPVLYSKNGHPLLAHNAVYALIKELLPLARVVTPNAPEAERLSGVTVKDLPGVKKAAKAIHELGPEYVLVKGGHFGGKTCSDLLFDGKKFSVFTYPRIATRNTHGTGCTLSAAIAAGLALGMDAPGAVVQAGAYVAGAIRNSFSLGGGHGPLNHFWREDAEN